MVPKFKILPKVHGFTDAAGVHHLPGEIVNLPAAYEGETWLERVQLKKEEKPMKEVPPSEVKLLPLGKSKKLKS